MSNPADIPPRFRLFGRPVERLFRTAQLKADHNVTFTTSRNNLDFSVAGGQLDHDLKGEAEVTWRGPHGLTLVGGLDTVGQQHVHAEIADVAQGLSLLMRGTHLDVEDTKHKNFLSVGAHYVAEHINAEVDVDVLHFAGSKHELKTSVATGYSNCFVGASATVALSAGDKEDHLRDYNVGFDYILPTAEVYIKTKEKMNKVEAGFVSRPTPLTTVGAMVKHNRNLHLSKVRLGAATRVEDMVVRGSVDTLGQIAVAVSVPTGSSMVVTGVGRVSTFGPEAGRLRVGLQVAL